MYKLQFVIFTIVITDLKKVISRKRTKVFGREKMRVYDRSARFHSRQGTPKLLLVRLSNFGIIFSDSIAIG